AVRNTTYPRAWVAYAAHPDFNPVTIVHHTNVPITIHTCDQLFDQHVVWREGSLDDLRDDGYFHFEMSVELGNLRHEAATKLLETSRASCGAAVPMGRR